jgi:hypothetical protein
MWWEMGSAARKEDEEDGDRAGIDGKAEEGAGHAGELLVPCSLPLGTRGGQRSAITLTRVRPDQTQSDSKSN